MNLFTVDGTLIEAWASHKSFQRKDSDDKPGAGSGASFHGEKRTNDTHESKTDPDARLFKKSAGQEAKLSYLGHVLVENRHGLIAAAMTTQADGTAERDAALLMVDDLQRGRSARITLGADKAYDTKDFVSTARELRVTPHVSQNTSNRQSAIDGRTTRHPRVQLRGLQPLSHTKAAGAVRMSAVRALRAASTRIIENCFDGWRIQFDQLKATWV